MSTRSLPLRVAALVLVLAATAFDLFWRLGAQTIMNDEQVYVSVGWQYVHGDFTGNTEHPPLAKFLFGAAQLVFGQGVFGPRLVAATAVLATGLLLFWWLRRPLGFWGALLAAGLWWLTPRAIGAAWPDLGSGIGARIDRFALLEPVMVVFAVASLACAWAWTREWRWWWPVLSGVFLGLSVSSKVTTAVLVVALITVPIVHRRWRALLIGAPLAAVASAAVVVLVYVPLGVVAPIQRMIAFQTAHNGGGHRTTINGVVYLHAPWWADFAFMANGIGWVMVAVLGVGVLAALVVRPDRLVVVLVVALAALMLFSTVVAHVALPHYYDVWMPFLVALAAVGYTRLARVADPRRPRAPRRSASEVRLRARRPSVSTAGVVMRVVATALALAAVVPAATLASTIAAARPAGIALLGDALRAEGMPADHRVLFVKYGSTWGVYFRGYASGKPEDGKFGALAIGPDIRYPVTPEVRSFLAENRDRLQHVRVDYLDVWVLRDGAEFAQQDGRFVIQG
ncbi:glycosyltransferase family 39 protein [Curtobacterium sp. MCLR17_007]|uniref:ArnT family glycosyltransferase n=1 Tax=Curtobacterium sp. MCLR17_007 TaxID=2175648 RepID=UPI0015E8CEF7|nr:glycosyltransferase family 39 protein [Curtobacterium sp. MCLR17_007]WIB59098.1 glycosyltransferase family 39 protein [Curtobacterium sp. MCLR17_007]